MFFSRRPGNTLPNYVPDVLDAARQTPIQNPVNGHEWLRVYPNDNSPRHALPIGTLLVEGALDLSPAQTLDKVNRHLRQLQKIGIQNPVKHHYLVGGNATDIGQAGTFLYTISHAVNGVNAVELRNDPQHRAAFYDLGQKLVQYTTWIQEAGEPHMLWDIQYPAQYVYGTTPNNAQPLPYLVDTDPILITSQGHVEDFRNSIQQHWLNRPAPLG